MKIVKKYGKYWLAEVVKSDCTIGNGYTYKLIKSADSWQDALRLKQEYQRRVTLVDGTGSYSFMPKL